MGTPPCFGSPRPEIPFCHKSEEDFPTDRDVARAQWNDRLQHPGAVRQAILDLIDANPDYIAPWCAPGHVNY